MTHQHGSGAEEVKESSQQQQTASTSAAPSPQPSPSQCCVFFAPSEWSRRYGEEFYTARVTDSRQQTDGSHAYGISVQCADSGWRVEQPYAAFRRLRSDIAASYRAQTDGDNALPSVPADKADAADMQSWMEATLQRKDISRLTAVRHFLNLDIPIHHPQSAQQDDSEDEQTAADGEEGDSRQTAAAAQ